MFNYTPQISVPFLENERKTHRRCIISNYFETNKSVCLPYKNYNNNSTFNCMKNVFQQTLIIRLSIN